MQENLTEQEKHMCDMLVRKMRRLPVEVKVSNQWHESTSEAICTSLTYRTPPRNRDIPWELIDDKWTAFAMDKNGCIKLFSIEPTIKTNSWSVGSMFEYCDCPLKIDTTGIDWKDSLTLRKDE